MHVELQEKADVHAKFSVSIPAQEVDNTYQKTLRALARQVKIPGFRPGRAPRGVLEAKIGKQELAQEVRDQLLESYYPKAIRELELTPVHVHVDAGEPVEGQDYRFEVDVELYPEFELPELSEIVIDSERQRVTDDMMQDTIERLRNEHATLVPVERPAQPGDQLVIESLRARAESDEEGEQDEPNSSFPLDLDNVGDELAEQFLGKTIGDEVEISLSPQAETDAEDEDADEASEDDTEAVDASAQDDAPPEAPTSLKVIIRDIKEKEKPEVDDEFAKTLGLDSWQEAEARIRKTLQAELDRESFKAQQDEFVEKIIAETDFDVPKSLIEGKKERLLESYGNDLQQRGTTLEQYLESLDEEKRSEFDNDLQDAAVTQAKRDVVLEKLVELRKPTVSREELDQTLEYMAMREGSTLAKLKKQLGERGLGNFRFMLARDKALREAVRELVGEYEEDDEDAPAQTEAAPEDVSAAPEANSGEQESAEPKGQDEQKM